MVGNGTGFHIKIFKGGGQFFDFGQTVEKWVFGMKMKMDKVGHELIINFVIPIINKADWIK